MQHLYTRSKQSSTIEGAMFDRNTYFLDIVSRGIKLRLGTKEWALCDGRVTSFSFEEKLFVVTYSQAKRSFDNCQKILFAQFMRDLHVGLTYACEWLYLGKAWQNQNRTNLWLFQFSINVLFFHI